MKKEFVIFPLALRLKALGFDEPCFGSFNTKGRFERGTSDYLDNSKLKILSDYFGKNSFCCLAPTWQSAFRWFREKHNLYAEIGLHDREDKKTWRFTISILGYYELAYNQNVGKEPYYKTYEEVELKCLEQLITILENKQ